MSESGPETAGGAKRGEWAGVLRDGISIVVSILLAFWIDAWWADKQDRAEEQESLISLEIDFHRNRELLVQARAEHDAIRSRGDSLLAAIRTFRSTGRMPDATDLVRRQTDWQTYDPVEGTLESLIGSGHLDLITSDSLRAALVAWPDQVADLNEDEEILRRAVRERILPAVFQHVSMQELAALSSGPDRPTPPEVRRGLAELMSSIEFENWVHDQVAYTAFLLEPGNEVDRLMRALDEILRLIEQQRRD